MKSELDNNKANYEYVFDYNSDTTTQFFAVRTAEEQAGWFLPLLQSGITLLDRGCGTGEITAGLAEIVEPGTFTGVDISENVLNRAREKAAENKITNIRFEVGDVCKLKYSDHSFDGVFSGHL